jgi:hypothetical protein
MHPIVFGTFIAISRIAVAMCSAGIAAFLVGLFAAKDEIAQARGLQKIVALTNLCVPIPLAVFGALHLFAPQFVLNIVPAYMPWRLFWAYFVGCGLVAASLSIASRVGVRWSGLLFGIMMFSFVAMIHFPGALRDPHKQNSVDDCFPRVVVRRSRLDSCSNCNQRMARAGENHADHGGANIDLTRSDRFWH